jgi:hypothetical protein
MSDFNSLDPTKPATLEAVVEAVLHLSTFDEAELLQLVSQGRLRELFPFRPARARELPPDFVAEESLVEASALPVSAERRRELIQSSMPSRPAKSTIIVTGRATIQRDAAADADARRLEELKHSSES